MLKEDFGKPDPLTQVKGGGAYWGQIGMEAFIDKVHNGGGMHFDPILEEKGGGGADRWGNAKT